MHEVIDLLCKWLLVGMNTVFLCVICFEVVEIRKLLEKEGKAAKAGKGEG